MCVRILLSVASIIFINMYIKTKMSKYITFVNANTYINEITNTLQPKKITKFYDYCFLETSFTLISSTNHGRLSL